MKKNAMLKIAAILMVAVLLTTCAISSTFAKYTTGGSASATEARVAKWGITVTATKAAGEDLFLNEYENDEGTVTVEGTGTDLVVAPGTENAASPFTVTVSTNGTPEVDYQMVVTADLVLSGWSAGEDTWYCPLVIKIGTTPICGLDYADQAAFEKAVEDAFAHAVLADDSIEINNQKKYVKPYEAGNAPAAVDEDDTAITWEWTFENYDGDVEDQDNAKDTLLGNAATPAKVSFAFSVTAEQID